MSSCMFLGHISEVFIFAKVSVRVAETPQRTYNDFTETVHGLARDSTEILQRDWHRARYMPGLNHELRIVTAMPFDLHTRQQFGRVQSAARALGW